MNGRFYVSFCLRDAILAWYWLSPSVCPSVCLSVTRRYDVETAGRIELVFGVKAIVGLSYTVLQGNLANSKNADTSLWNFVPNSRLRTISPLHVDRTILPWHIDHRKCCQLSSTDDRCQLITLSVYLCV